MTSRSTLRKMGDILKAAPPPPKPGGFPNEALSPELQGFLREADPARAGRLPIGSPRVFKPVELETLSERPKRGSRQATEASGLTVAETQAAIVELYSQTAQAIAHRPVNGLPLDALLQREGDETEGQFEVRRALTERLAARRPGETAETHVALGHVVLNQIRFGVGYSPDVLALLGGPEEAGEEQETAASGEQEIEEEEDETA